MDKEKLDAVLKSHSQWLLDCSGGEKADLRGADLYGANLRVAYLRGADLGGAIGFYLLPVQDRRGYSFPHAIQHDAGWRIRVGCRDFTIAEARQHWGASYGGKRWIGDMYLHACDWLEQMIASEQ